MLRIMLAVLVSITFAAPARSCPDLNQDGVLDNADIGIFIDAFIQSSTIADFNGDGLLDNGDIVRFVDEYLANDCDEPQLQSFRGGLRLDAPAGNAILSSGPVASASASNGVVGSLGGSTSGWCAMRLRFESDPAGTGPMVVLALGDQRANQVPEVFGVRLTGDGSAIAAYLRDRATGDWLAIGVVPIETWTIGTEYWLCWVWDAGGLDTFRFPSARPGDTSAAFVWSEESGWAAAGLGSLGFAAIGRATASEGAQFFWRIGSEVASGPVLSIGEVAVSRELGPQVSEEQLVAVAEGRVNPCGITGITHVWALDRRSSDTPSGSEIERMDLVGSAHLTQLGSGVSWTPAMRGPTGQSASDPMTRAPVNDLLEGNVAALRALIATRDYDVWQFSDSFGVDWVAARFWHAMTSALSREQYPVIGWSNGFRHAAGSRANSTIVSEVSSGVPYVNVGAVLGAGTYNNAFEGETRRVGFPTDASVEFAGPVPFPGGVVGEARIRRLYAGRGSGTSSDWLETPGTTLGVRALVQNAAPMSFTLQLGTEAPRAMDGDWAMPRWSDGENPFTDPPRRPADDETLTWLASDHLPTDIVGGQSSILVHASDVPAGEFLGLAGWSVHLLGPDGRPVASGINYANFSISSQSMGALGTSRMPSRTTVKEFADSELLNVVNGTTWTQGRRLLVVMDIADLMPDPTSFDLWMFGDGSEAGGGRDEIRAVGFLNRARWAAQAVGYGEVQFLLVSNFMHTDRNEADLFALRQEFLDTEANLRRVALGEPDVSLLSVFRFLGGAIGVANEQVVRLSGSPAVYASAGWPHRESRYLESLLAERDGIALNQHGMLLDQGGLHTESSVLGIADWNQIGYAIWTSLLDTP